MAVALRGNSLSTLTRTHGAILTQADDGSWEGDVIFHCKWIDAPSLAPRRNLTVHPDFSTLKCSKVTIAQLKPGTIAKVSAHYKGIFDPPTPLEEVITNTSEAPIETHDRFVSTLGGTADDVKNDAHFDENGKFDGFLATSKYAGVTSYLFPNTIYRVTSISTTRPTSIAGVGKVNAIPTPIDLPNGAMNWVLISFTWRLEGAVYVIVKDYMLSGRKGFDADVYG